MKMKFVFMALLCIGAMTLAGCHHHEDEHEHHHDAEQYTAYGTDFELFAEIEPLVVGEETHLVCHLTRLSNFKPLDSTQVTLHLIVGDIDQSCLLEAPQQPGIYRFVLTPQIAGCGRLLLQIATGDTVAEVLYPHLHVLADHEDLHNHGDVHVHEHAREHGHEHADHHTHASDDITFTKEQSWKVDFATEEVRPMQFGTVIKCSAQVLPSQGDEREASAKAAGIVVFANASLVEGSAVSAGQTLFSIESNGMADNNMSVKYQEAVANYNAAKAEYERKQSLAKDRIVSQNDLDRSRSAFESAKAVYDNLKGNFSQSGAVVSAPISGFVKHITVRNGAYVEAGQPVVTIAQNRDLFVRAEVQPRYYADLHHIVSANIQLPNGRGTYSLDELGGQLVGFAKATDADNPLLPVTFRLRNQIDLIPGTFVTMFLRSNSDQQVLTLPNTGIVEEMGNYFVFVQQTPERFEKRFVTLGGSDGLRTVITSGIQTGERVVSKGAVLLKLAQSSGSLDPHAGHVH